MERRYKFRPTTLSERTWIVWMWQCGLSARLIAQESGTSVTTVCRWIRRWTREGNVNTRPRLGRPPRITTSSGEYIRSNIAKELLSSGHDVCIPRHRSAVDRRCFSETYKKNWPSLNGSRLVSNYANPICRHNFGWLGADSV